MKLFKFCTKSLQLTPHQLWLSSKRMERPFTGDYWHVKDVGTYHCINCDSLLFKSDQKFLVPTGMASFWTHENALEVLDEEIQLDNTNVNVVQYKQENGKACQCKNVYIIKKCKSFLGTLHPDGPPPTFLRFNINSGSIQFKLKPWFEDPTLLKKNKKKELQEQKLQKEKEIDQQKISNLKN